MIYVLPLISSSSSARCVSNTNMKIFFLLFATCTVVLGKGRGLYFDWGMEYKIGSVIIVNAIIIDAGKIKNNITI